MNDLIVERAVKIPGGLLKDISNHLQGRCCVIEQIPQTHLRCFDPNIVFNGAVQLAFRITFFCDAKAPGDEDVRGNTIVRFLSAVQLIIEF